MLNGGFLIGDSGDRSDNLRASGKRKLRVNIKDTLELLDKRKVDSLTEDLEIITVERNRTITDEFEDEEVEFEREENVPISKLVLKPEGESHNHNGFSSKKRTKKKRDQ